MNTEGQSAAHLDVLQRIIVLRGGLWEVGHTLLDAPNHPVEHKAVVCVQLVAEDCPDAVHIQLRLLSAAKDLQAGPWALHPAPTRMTVQASRCMRGLLPWATR